MVKAKAELECVVTEKEHQLNLIKKKLRESTKPDQSQNHEAQEQSESVKNQEAFVNDLNNLLIYDAKDPNRPRFTLNELQKVLMEKNQLTVKLDQTKDELEQLRRM